jgi:hypothetical protein
MVIGQRASSIEMVKGSEANPRFSIITPHGFTMIVAER